MHPLPNSHPYNEKMVKVVGEVKIGRASLENPCHMDNLLFKSQVLSRQHAIIWYNNETKQVYLKDNNSSNGTYVNDVAISRMNGNSFAELHSGDIVQFGADIYSESTGVHHKAVVSIVTVVTDDANPSTNDHLLSRNKSYNQSLNLKQSPPFLNPHQLSTNSKQPLPKSVCDADCLDITPKVAESKSPSQDKNVAKIEISTAKYVKFQELVVELVDRVKASSTRIKQLETAFQTISQTFDDFNQGHFDASLMATRLRSLEYQIDVYTKLYDADENTLKCKLISAEKKRLTIESQWKSDINKITSKYGSLQDDLLPIVDDMDFFLDTMDRLLDPEVKSEVDDDDDDIIAQVKESVSMDLCYFKLCQLFPLIDQLLYHDKHESIELNEQFRSNNNNIVTIETINNGLDLMNSKLNILKNKTDSLLNETIINQEETNKNHTLNSKPRHVLNLCKNKLFQLKTSFCNISSKTLVKASLLTSVTIVAIVGVGYWSGLP